MGSSQKKKNEKKKDFQKARLKVGKTKPKASNYTDTSFRSKSIVLNQQSLSTSAPTVQAQFKHSVSLLSSKTDSQRRDALAHLTTFIKARPVDTPLPQPMSMFLPSLLPLILDASKGVRTQLLKLFQVLPKEELVGTAAQILPYVRAGLTHLAADIRVSSIDILSWLLSVLGEEVVSCSGGWIKTLNCFLSVLGWHTEESTKWSASRTSFGKAGTDGKPVAKALAALAEFLRVGIVPEEPEENEEEQRPLGWRYWPLRDYEFHMMPTRPNPYGYLNLFGPPRDEEDAPYETIDDRLRVFNENFRTPIERGLDAARREGGEAGRASALVLKVLKDAGVEEGEEA